MPGTDSDTKKTAKTAGGPRLTPKEKQDYVEQVEEFEGPDRREKRGTEEATADEPGVARS